MNNSEKIALDLLNEVRVDKGHMHPLVAVNRDDFRVEALCRSADRIEALEAENERLRGLVQYYFEANYDQ